MADDQSNDSDLTMYRMSATRLSPKRTRVDTGDATFVVGKDVNPVEYFVGGVLACLNSTGTMVARDMEIDIESMELSVEGGVNYDRYSGLESDDRAGLQGLAVEIDLEADADEDELEAWLDAVKDRCPVTDNFENETPLSVSIV